jgi:hypothetical protein
MSMYTQLLGSALDQRDDADIGADSGDVLARLSTYRARLRPDGPDPDPREGFEAVADALNYDVALIVLARSLDIEFAVERFDNGERHLLEAALAERGFSVGQRGDAP